MARRWVATIAATAVACSSWYALGSHSGDLAAHYGDCTAARGAPDYQRLDQGLDTKAEQAFWFTSQGSRMLPRSWFLALEQPGGRGLFSDRTHLESFGFIGARVSACNPDGLPIGFALDQASGEIGLTCAACHTRRIDHEGRSILVNGGPSEIDLPRFIARIAESLEYTLASPDAWQRFVQRLGPGVGAPAELRASVAERAAGMRQFQRYVSAGSDDDGRFAGIGRVDAFGAIFNRVTVDAIGLEGNYAPADAPVNYPFVWGAPQGATTQWNGAAPNHVPFGPLARNMGVALGLFGPLQLDRETRKFSAELPFENLQQLESITEQLRAPHWQDAGLPPVDAALAERGKRLYRAECSGCHALRTDAGGAYAPRLVALEQVATDPAAAENYFARTARTGVLEGSNKTLFGDERFAVVAPSRELVVAAITGVIADNASSSVQLADVAALANARPAKPGAAYKARPLDGIWATAPYLHNASVPSLRDLLEPAEARPAVFTVAAHSLDPVRVGVAQDAGGAIFDTTLRGNSNTGHDFGTRLAPSEKDVLVEFLKTL